MRRGIVLIKISFNVKKDKTRLPIADHEIKWLTRRDFFDDELVCGRIQRFGKNSRVSPDQPHRAQIGTAQNLVKDEDREKGIGAHVETESVQFRFLRPGADPS